MEKVTTLVSIVLPTYNRGYCIARTIDSVVSQTYKYWELIIVDNDSTDNTHEVLSRYSDDPRIKVVQIDNGGIIARSRNAGIELCKGLIVAFIDSDDPWLPRKLEHCIHWMMLGNDFVYHDLFAITHKRKTGTRRLGLGRRLGKSVVKDLIRSGNAIPTSSVLVKRELLARCHGFQEEEDLIGIEDYDLWVRIACLTDSFYFVDEPLGFYTKGEGTLNNRLRLRTLSSIKARHKVLHTAHYGTTPEWLDLALARLLVVNDARASRRIVKEVLKSKSVDFRRKSEALTLLWLSYLVEMKVAVLRRI